MAEVEFEAVLEFLRKNGFFGCISALMEDITDKNSASDGPDKSFDHVGSKGLSDDEFVSWSSSTSESFADFANPCGVRIRRPASHASSDRLSQFGTARNYLDSDMQFDLFDPSADKFIMSVQTGQTFDDQREMSEKCTNHSNHKTYEDCDELESLEEERHFSDFDKCNEQIQIKEEFDIFDLRIIHRKNRTGFEENTDFPIVLDSVIAGRYHVEEFLGSTGFSRVVQAHDLCTGIDVCLKIINNNKDFLDQSLDEIKILKFVNYRDPADERHILRLYNYFYHQEHLFIVTELLYANLYEFQKYNRESGDELYFFTLRNLQVITRQVLEALAYLNDWGIIHCDLKPENILIKSYKTCEIKVIDFGSSCLETDDLSLYVQSRSYRAPEVMLGLPYDHKIDLWSVGCILTELYSGEVLFPNEPVGMLLARMIGMLGPIDTNMLRNGRDTHKYFTEEYDLYQINEDTKQVEYIIANQTSLKDHLQISDYIFLDFLTHLLEINPTRRATAREALDHPWLSCSYDS
ncbi:Protein kinase superfamily protein [Striga hermonthica]|uniref:Protein kinase superfamily protein n=1 Tax=Striga hermonthica TaxID=68872 RepID=A0A9N7NS66_STRHE|nr:Protein kinase superfamily protein [Striga hermonthica]